MEEQPEAFGQIDTSAARLEDTLDEPVFVTVKRDVLAVATKFAFVFLPKKGKRLLHDCRWCMSV
jgi:hypothetical protein